MVSAVVSLVIGLILLIIMLAFINISFELFWMGQADFNPSMFLIVSSIINLAGFIFGILGLKSEKKGKAILGLIFCSLVWIIFIFVILYANGLI
jgi:hypothetical protein